MDIVVGSRQLLTEVVTALDATGREHLVIVTKASWSIPGSGQRSRPLAPTPLAGSDAYYGEPGLSAMRCGNDFARFKPRCDVLFDAKAHSPTGRAVTELTAAWQVGDLKKAVRVVGPRTWKRTLGIHSLTDPQPFIFMPLHYGYAFGGTLPYEEGRGEQKRVYADALAANPAGRGWAGDRTMDQVDGLPAACLEPLTTPITRPDAKIEPVAFSAIGRHWTPRRHYGGTYDDHWRKNVFPLMPEDFDDRFEQCAPVDQQMDYPAGGDAVVLRNMLRGRGDVRFQLPRLDHLKVRVLRRDLSVEEPTPRVDTLFFESDAEAGPRFSAVWRASVPLRRRVHEIDTVAVGPVNSQWWRDKVLGLGEGGCMGCGASPVAEEVST